MTSDDRQVLYQGSYFALVSDPTHTEFVRCGDETLVVALDGDGQVLLTLEPSAAFPGRTVILPGGATSPDQPIEVTADHELQEEVGFCARRWNYLGELRPFSKYLTVRSYVFLARDLVPSQMQGDEGYKIEVERVPLASFESLIEEKRLLDARVIAALYRARAFVDAENKSDEGRAAQ